MKTDQLFKEYYRILNEQEPAPAPEAAPAAMSPVASPPQEATPTEPAEPTTRPIDANERLVIKILTNAFIFNKTLFDENKRLYIDNKIKEIQNYVNVPVAKIIDEVKKIINLDKSLHVESKTLKLLSKYKLLIEKPADATEPQKDIKSQDQSKDTKPESPEENINDLNLAEIFPEYKELILLSLHHVPTAEEIMILRPIVREFSQIDPEKIATTIKDLLNFKESGTTGNSDNNKSKVEGDDSLEQYLANA